MDDSERRSYGVNYDVKRWRKDNCDGYDDDLLRVTPMWST